MNLARRDASRVPITIAVKKSVGLSNTLCQAANISATGMLVAKVYEGFYPDLPKCWLRFNLPGSDVTIEARGEVVRQARRDRYHLMAVRFGTLAPSHRRLIEDYIEQPKLMAAPIFAA